MDKLRQMWTKVSAWRIWRPHPILIGLLSGLSVAGLSWVFLTGRDYTWYAYLIYPFSAYSLIVLCVGIPRIIAFFKRHTKEDPVFQTMQRLEGDGAFGLGMYLEQFINFCYGGFKLVSGAIIGSAWIGADGLYNFTQGVIQLYQILRHRNATDKQKQWRVYRNCGYLMIFVNLTMTGMMFQMIQMGRHEDNTEIGIIATAAFTFYKLINALVETAKDRKHKNPVDSAVYFLDLGQGLYNLFVLQVGLLWTFGGANYPYKNLLNNLTGTVVCILSLGIGIYMLWRSKRDGVKS